ncbi:MAG: rod shape-determining protein [Geobacteraceae bacterium]|jgi:actin-like ATPase involved in cell morphogenesis|nr:rod shape-determining protein [Geobacteraceae bacterium]
MMHYESAFSRQGLQQFLLQDLSSDIGCKIIKNGIYLSGGRALLSGMRERLEEMTLIFATMDSKPLEAVVSGECEMLPIVSLSN